MLDMGGLEPRTTQLVGAHEVRWTSALSGPKRSGDRVPDVSLKRRLSIERRFFNARHGRTRTTDNAVGRGARRPGDVWSARTGAERRHEVRWTSALSGPKRSGERVPDVSYLEKLLILSCPN